MYINTMLIPTQKSVKTITEMREKTLELLDFVEKEGLAYIFHRSKPKAVLIRLEDFIALNELIEDYSDKKEAQSLAKERKEKGTPLEKILQKYV